MAEDSDDEMQRWTRERGDLEPDLEVLRAYAEEHPDIWGGLEIDTYRRPVGLLAFVTGDVDEHAARLRSRVRYPSRLDVRLAVMSERDLHALARRLFDRLRASLPHDTSLGVAPTLGGRLLVMLPDGCDPVAEELEREHGDLLIVQRGVILRNIASGEREAELRDA